MKFNKISLNQLKPAKYNPRQISDKEFKQLSINLNKFGLVDPIIINTKTNVIIGGHQRYKALKSKYTSGNIKLDLLKLGDIGWCFFNKNLNIPDENYEKALNLSLNKISGEWDKNKLSKLLNELNDDGFNTDLTGFRRVELDLFTDDEIEFNEKEIFENYVPTIRNIITCPHCGNEFKIKRLTTIKKQ